ncbi:MAG: hypothetical protein R6X17_03970 [Candidatus Competibacteraceae bacterium]
MFKTSHRENRVVAVSAERMFDVVADVERYHEHLHPSDGQGQGEQDDEKPKRFVSALRSEKRLGHDPKLPAGCAERRHLSERRFVQPFAD